MATTAKEDERKFILECIEVRISFFTGFVECQELGLQQQNGKKKLKIRTSASQIQREISGC
jgi:hypothetical protein